MQSEVLSVHVVSLMLVRHLGLWSRDAIFVCKYGHL